MVGKRPCFTGARVVSDSYFLGGGFGLAGGLTDGGLEGGFLIVVLLMIYLPFLSSLVGGLGA